MEQDQSPSKLSAIQIDLVARSITLQADQTATRLTFTPSGILYELLGFPIVAEHSLEHTSEGRNTSAATDEKEASVVITGRLKTVPKEGRVDKSGNPTAWAKLAAHEDGQNAAHMYSTTFHRHTTRIALALEQDAQITLQGYVRTSSDPKRMDRLSVFNLLAYPGKPTSGQQ